jgi:hypothetical protein
VSSKQDLIDALNTEVHKVGSLTAESSQPFSGDDFTLYNVIYYEETYAEASGGILSVRNATMIVEDDGGAGEEAWWREGSPKVITAFGDRVRQSNKFDSVHGSIMEEGPDWAVVKGYSLGTDTATLKHWLLEDNGVGGIDDYEITNY